MITARISEKGSALIAALFLVIVVGTLGVFAVRLQANQQQGASLQLQEYRALAAAHAGLEFWSNRIANAPGTNCGAQPLILDGHAGFRGFRVDTTCTRIAAGGGWVYEVTAEGRAGVFGSPDFVRRTRTRQIATTPNVYQ